MRLRWVAERFNRVVRRDAEGIADDWRLKRAVKKVEADNVRILDLQNQLLLYGLEQQLKDLRREIDYVG